MKLRLFAFLTLSLICFQESRAQYKDLEGVFFGKVIGLGVGGSVHAYKDKSIGTVASFTPITYSVVLNSKTITSMRLAFHQKFKSTFEGNDGFTDYSQTVEYKFIEIELGYKIALTADGLDKPTSLFLNLQGGSLLGKTTITDSRYGDMGEGPGGNSYVGAGLSVFQRMGSRIVFFAEPVYRIGISHKISLGDNGEKKINLANLSGHAGVMFMIGKSN